MDSSNYQLALDLLYNRINYERSSPTPYNAQNFRLDRMRSLLERLGNPQSQYPIVHIAGTKGKGTTASLIYEGLRANRMRVGLYTSPHLLKVEERFQMNGAICSETDFIALVRQVMVQAETLERSEWGPPTFFEITTAMGMLYFAQQSAQCAVLEVGLGGRLDSTNVSSPLLTLITSISLDHQAQLGSTIREIAGEKAGIIKPGVPVISTALHPNAREVFVDVATQNGSLLMQLDRDFSYQWNPTTRESSKPGSDTAMTAGPFSTVVYTSADSANFRLGDSPWQLNLLGKHQAQNLSGAITALNWLAQNTNWRIDPQITRTAIANAKVTGRLQIVGKDPLRIIDTAHNPASVAAALEAIHDHFGDAPRVIVFASSRDKDYRAMLEQLLPNCERLICTAFLKNPRAVPPQDLVDLARQVHKEQHVKLAERPGLYELADSKIQMCESPIEAWQEALGQCPSGGMVISIGSFFLAAELMEQIQ